MSIVQPAESKTDRTWGSVPQGLGRYWLPTVASGYGRTEDSDWPLVPEPGGFLRTTNLVGANVDTRALGRWEMARAMFGLRRRPDLLEELSVFPLDQPDSAILELAERAKEADGSAIAREQGTHRHTMLETWIKTGERVGTPAMLLQLDAIRDAFTAYRLDVMFSEVCVVNEELNCAGRFDLGLLHQDTGELEIGDLKTKQRQFWTFLDVEAQLAVYAHARIVWNPDLLRYEDAPAWRKDVAAVLHVPVDQPKAFIRDADLERGWAAAKHARITYDQRSAAGKAAVVGNVRALPAPVDPHLARVETYARRFAAVQTRDEWVALYREAMAAGVDAFELGQVAREARVRILDAQGVDAPA